MFQSEIKTSGFDTKVETFPATNPPLPGTNRFTQSRGWTVCMYHLAQSWVCCWLFGYWESKPRGFSFITTLQGDSVWQYYWPGRTAPEVPGVLCSTAPWDLHHLRCSTGSVCNRRMEAVLPKGVPESLCASQTSLWACSGGKGWCIISFPSQTSYYCFGQFIPLRMYKANKPCSP